MKITAKAGQQVLEVEIERSNGRYVVEVDGVRHLVDAHKLEADFYSLLTGGRSYEVSVEVRGEAYHVRHGAAEQRVTLTDPSRRAREGGPSAHGPEKVVSMMPGKVVRVLVAPGERVAAGQALMVVEAMKMENEISSTRDGTVKSVDVERGQRVEGGALLAVIE
ncbi:MAG TPA: biotin/lipoyl-containing protein [Candidatus Polarisedimenticolaceae bacterium]|nr:biotin/lipoyl-containing protein [Candidatus Polarisedimenticolaceae bacterium]